jgi:hypothetical protein
MILQNAVPCKITKIFYKGGHFSIIVTYKRYGVKSWTRGAVHIMFCPLPDPGTNWGQHFAVIYTF